MINLKINTQKLIEFPYLSQQEYMFILNGCHLKFPIINLTKDIQIISEENNKTLLKNIKEVLSKWSNILCSRIVKFSIIKMSISQIDLWI